VRKREGRGFAGKPGPWNTVLRWLRAISIPNRQFGGRGGKSIETGKGGRSSVAGGLPAAAALGGGVAGSGGEVDALTGADPEIVGEAEAAVAVTGGRGGDPAPAPAGGAVDSVRPSDAATEDAPTPGTDGSIKLAEPDAELRGIAPEVKLTSVVGRESGLAAGSAESGAGPACDNLGSKPAGL
jgi:hypothetical protein